MSRFHEIYDKITHSLNGFPYDKLGISEEVKEQVIQSSSIDSLPHFNSYLHICMWSGLPPSGRANAYATQKSQKEDRITGYGAGHGHDGRFLTKR